MSERDIHFQGAAKLLSEKLNALYLRKGLEAILGDPTGEVKQQEITLFAQFSYDLVLHTFQNYWISHNPEWDAQRTPDMVEWPEKPDETG